MNNNEIMNNEIVAKPVIANIKAQIEQKKMAAEEKTVILEESDVVSEDN